MVTPNSLVEIGTKSKSDKVQHGYLPLYDRHFQDVTIQNLLELGIFRGHSLALWRAWKPEARVEGWDLHPRHVEGCVTRKVNLESRLSIRRVLRHSGPSHWDVVIDDAGHTMRQQQLSLSLLFSRSRYFVVEDLHTSFDSRFFRANDQSTFNLLEALAERGRWSSKYSSDEERFYIESNAEILCLSINQSANGAPSSGIAILKNRSHH